MNIIFGENIKELHNKYTVLELDTFCMNATGGTNTAYCVLELIPLNELALTTSLVDLHANLLANYKKRDWNYCEQAIEQLVGKWGGELDTFYIELQNRIGLLKTQDLDDSWSPVIKKP